MIYKCATKEYLDDMTKIFIEAFNSEPWNEKWTEDIVKKRLLQLMNFDDFYGIVALDNDNIIGFILGNDEYYYNSTQFIIKEFCVDTKIKGMGIGKQIIEEFENRLKRRGVNEIVLMTLRSDDTLGFYNKRGYKNIDDLVMMNKSI